MLKYLQEVVGTGMGNFQALSDSRVEQRHMLL